LIELLICKALWNLNSIQFILFARPVVIQPPPVFLGPLLTALPFNHVFELIRGLGRGLNEVSDKCHETRAEAALREETQLQGLDANDLIILYLILAQ
jgi:hypothetical protein